MSPCAKFNKFQLTFSYRITVVYIYSDMKILQDQRHQGSKKKDEKDQKMVSHLPLYYLLWMSDILLVQKTFIYHGNLTSNHGSRASKIADHASRPFPCHAENLVWITHHAANFGAITRHAKTNCHITMIYLFRSAIECALKGVTAYLSQFLKKRVRKNPTSFGVKWDRNLQRNAAHLHQTFRIEPILQVSLGFKEANLE